MRSTPRLDWSAESGGTVDGPERLAALVERLIAAGDLLPGDHLPSERDFSLLLGMSRASVREAIHELELKGTVERIPGRGSRILEPRDLFPGASLLGKLEEKQRTLAEMQDLRAAVEPSVAARAAVRATRAEILQLEQSLDYSLESVEAGESVARDREFHGLVAKSTHNPLFLDLVETTAEWTADVRDESHRTHEGRCASHAGHVQILEAIRNADADAAYAAMHEHLQTVSDLIRTRPGRDGDSTPPAPSAD
ncbi:MAG: FadR/GntR family transcriptional regulator [Nocardioidaceae bacterium]